LTLTPRGARSAAVRLAFQPLDKAFLAGTRAPWATFAPTWRLEYRGPLEQAALERALTWTVARYPSCAARVVALGGPFERARDYAWECPDAPAAPPVEVLDVTARSPEDARREEEALASRFLDLEREAPLRCTWVRRGPAAGVLVFQQHHALADGRAFLGFLGDLVRALDAAARGATSSPLPAALVTRRPEREAVAGSGVGDWLRAALAFFGEVLRALFAPVTPLASNVSADFHGADRTRHLEVPLARVEAWRANRAHHGLSTNDLLAGALCAALARWSHERGHPPGRHTLFMPVDVRPRDSAFESFANHLSSVQVRWRGTPDAQPLALARELRDAAKRQHDAGLPRRRVRFDGALVAATRVDVLRRELLDRRRLVTSCSFSNLVPLGTPGAGADGRWRFGDAVVERLLITTPCTPPQAANTTVARYGDALCFNFNFKDSAVSAAAIDALVRHFASALDELDAALRPAQARGPTGQAAASRPAPR
jgi:hypothetical protein